MNKKDKAFFFGFSRWKHRLIEPFFYEYYRKDIHFINPIFSEELNLACKKGLSENSKIYIWGRKKFTDVEEFARQKGILIYHVEDGFIRSIGLGSDLTQPYSLVIDKLGIYFDPTCPSELEEMLQNQQFDEELIQRAVKLKKEIIKNKISKYNADIVKSIHFSTKKKIALVSGQVEDDASIRYGAPGMTNLALLQKVKEKYGDRYIVFKPHPDVLSGNRPGHVESELALQYCDEIVSDVSMASVLEAVDEVHTMTSLSGFEGLIFGKQVYTYGMPFYAGWGLTIDERKCERRTKKRTLDELIVAVYILYPRYISPLTKRVCEVEEMIEGLKKQKEALGSSFLLRAKFKIYSLFSRIGQRIF